MREPGLLTGVIMAIAIGAIGGAIFFQMALPLAWMLGAMCATTLAALAGAPLAFWSPLRTIMIAIIAALLGSGFTPEVLERAGNWFSGVVVVVLFPRAARR